MGSSVAPVGHKARVTKRLATSLRCCWSPGGEGGRWYWGRVACCICLLASLPALQLHLPRATKQRQLSPAELGPPPTRSGFGLGLQALGFHPMRLQLDGLM